MNKGSQKKRQEKKSSINQLNYRETGEQWGLLASGILTLGSCYFEQT